jgi:hypothetical protein
MADPDTRLYGMADSSNHQSAAENGMRGEGAADAADPTYRHRVTLPGQPAIMVEETSGVAAVEATRPEPAPAPTPELKPVPQAVLAPVPAPEIEWAPRPAAHPAGGTALPWVIVAAILGFAAGRSRRPREQVVVPPPPPAALTRLPGEAGGFSQVRDAGQHDMRDPQPRWSAVDEASDESFPASDPPAMSIPGR